MKLSTWTGIAGLLVVVFVTGPVLGQESRPQDEPPAEEAPLYTEEQQAAIKGLFKSDVVGFTPKGVMLMYFFSTMKEEPLEDWSPPIETTRKRIRWPMRSDNASGLVFSEEGLFLHRAVWKTVQAELSAMNRSATRPGDTFMLGIAYDKKKRFLGSNFGRQILGFKGPKLSGKPIPNEPATAAFQESLSFGLEFSPQSFRSLRNGSKTADTADDPDLAKKAESGQIALRWSGQIKVFLSSVKIEGELDPAWLAKELPDLFGKKKR